MAEVGKAGGGSPKIQVNQEAIQKTADQVDQLGRRAEQGAKGGGKALDALATQFETAKEAEGKAKTESKAAVAIRQTQAFLSDLGDKLHRIGSCVKNGAHITQRVAQLVAVIAPLVGFPEVGLAAEEVATAARTTERVAAATETAGRVAEGLGNRPHKPDEIELALEGAARTSDAVPVNPGELMEVAEEVLRSRGHEGDALSARMNEFQAGLDEINQRVTKARGKAADPGAPPEGAPAAGAAEKKAWQPAPERTFANFEEAIPRIRLLLVVNHLEARGLGIQPEDVWARAEKLAASSGGTVGAAHLREATAALIQERKPAQGGSPAEGAAAADRGGSIDFDGHASLAEVPWLTDAERANLGEALTTVFALAASGEPRAADARALLDALKDNAAAPEGTDRDNDRAALQTAVAALHRELQEAVRDAGA